MMGPASGINSKRKIDKCVLDGTEHERECIEPSKPCFRGRKAAPGMKMWT